MKKKVMVGFFGAFISWSAVLAQQPNVVIFYADDFGWGDLRVHNPDPAAYRYTPHMDTIFTEGVELANYLTHCVCSPSRAGLLTGKHYATVDQGPNTGGTLDHTLPNFAKDFQSAGYATGAFGKWHNSKPNFPAGGNGAVVDFNSVSTYSELHKDNTVNLTNNVFEKCKSYSWGVGVNAYGFDRWVGYYNGGGDFFDRYDSWHKEVDWWHDLNYCGNETGYTTDLITHYACEFIQANQATPFLCYVPQQATHNPIQLPRADLEEFCQKLDTELGISGQWEYVSAIVSPLSGRQIGAVEQLRFDAGKEFDLAVIDPGKTHFQPLIYAAYCYTLDKSIGAIIKQVEEIGQLNNTIFVFASDNGGTKNGINLPFKGLKGTLWEGGTHVPAAIWWPGTLDKNSAPYSPGDNQYSGLIGYIDLYPTLMSMARIPISGTDLDGIDCWDHLQARTACRTDMLSDAMFLVSSDHGALRAGKWKLMISESSNRQELYDLALDAGETTDVAGRYDSVVKHLSGLYKNWLTKNHYAVSYIPIASSDILFPLPAPSGDVLEVRATQAGTIGNQDTGGVAIRFSTGREPWDETTLFVGGGDRIEFDIYIHPDSQITRGCYYTPGNGWDLYYKAKNGLNQDGFALPLLDLPKGVWTRQVIGVGSMSPSTIDVNYLVLNSPVAGTYHYYLDNIIVRKSDGTIRNVIWTENADFSNLIYRYKNKNYNTLAAVKKVAGFPFSDIQLTATVNGPMPPVSKPDKLL